MEKIKSLLLVAALVLSLGLFVVACQKKEPAPTPTPVAPMTPATEVPAGQ
jgi:hypothetical protein